MVGRTYVSAPSEGRHAGRPLYASGKRRALSVIPVKTGIQILRDRPTNQNLDSRVRGNDEKWSLIFTIDT